MSKVEIEGLKGTVCVDTGASGSIASTCLYKKLKDKCEFYMELVYMKLADGSSAKKSMKSANVNATLEGRTFKLNLLVLSEEQDNNTLPGFDFLKRANIILALGIFQWYFEDNSTKKYPLMEQPNVFAAVDTKVITEQQNACTNVIGRARINEILSSNADVFAPKVPPTPCAEHRIITEPDTQPIASPPYKIAGQILEALQKETDDLLEDDIMEMECESPWSAPVIIIPKPDGSMRLFVDYRGLNAVNINGSYPIPMTNHILHAVKRTKCMKILDLKSGYHQTEI